MLPPITATQQFRLTITPKNRKGGDAPVDGVPVWATSNDAAAAPVPDDNGLSALIVGHGPGDYTITCSADADMGAGVQTIVETDSGSVTMGTAVSLGGFSVGPVEEQP